MRRGRRSHTVPPRSTAIDESGPAGISLRDLARRAGVSHAAPAHHFGDKAGLLTALATEGYDMLADAVTAAQQRTGDLVETGLAYVRFAVERRAHFQVMFRPDLYRADDPALRAAGQRAAEALSAAVATVPAERKGSDPALASVAAWSLVHGFATLWLNGVLPPEVGDDPELAARSVAGLLFGDRRPALP